MFGLFEKLTKRTAEVQLTSRQKWRNLIEQIADGQEPSEEVALSILDETGHTLGELRANVKRLKSRRQSDAEIVSAKKRQATRAATVKELEKVEATFEEARRVYDEARNPLEYKLEQIDRIPSEIRQHEADLASTAGPELLAEIAEARKRVGQIEREIRQQASWLETRTREAKFTRDERRNNQGGLLTDWLADDTLPTGKVSQFESVQKDYERKCKEVKNLESAIASLRAKQDQAMADVKALEARRLDPAEIF